MRARRTRHVVVVGAGNIGSHLVPHVARMSDVARLTIVDPGAYDQANRGTQDIDAADAGRAKARVAAARARRIEPALAVEPWVAAIEDVPPGRVRADAVVAALDTRAARQIVNGLAFGLGVPWIDTGVGGGGSLARVNVYVPGPEAVCLECAWDERDYAEVETLHPCGARAAPATGAVSALGALAAALAAIELRKLLDGDLARAAVARQVTVDAAHHRLLVSRLARRASCRRVEHDPWRFAARGPRSDTTLREWARGADAADDARIAVEGRAFALRWTCTRCGRVRDGLRLQRRGAAPRACGCGGALAVAAIDVADRLVLAGLAPRVTARTLASLGVRGGDILRLEDARGARRYEVVARAVRCRTRRAQPTR